MANGHESCLDEGIGAKKKKKSMHMDMVKQRCIYDGVSRVTWDSTSDLRWLRLTPSPFNYFKIKNIYI
jgi:hypothetical protein